MVKEDAVLRDAIEGGGLANIVVSVDARVGPAPVVGNREDNVGPFGGLQCCGQDGKEEKDAGE